MIEAGGCRRSQNRVQANSGEDAGAVWRSGRRCDLNSCRNLARIRRSRTEFDLDAEVARAGAGVAGADSTGRARFPQGGRVDAHRHGREGNPSR